jgi:hypothetical protein
MDNKPKEEVLIKPRRHKLPDGNSYNNAFKATLAINLYLLIYNYSR